MVDYLESFCMLSDSINDPVKPRNQWSNCQDLQNCCHYCAGITKISTEVLILHLKFSRCSICIMYATDVIVDVMHIWCATCLTSPVCDASCRVQQLKQLSGHPVQLYKSSLMASASSALVDGENCQDPSLKPPISSEGLLKSLAELTDFHVQHHLVY